MGAFDPAEPSDSPFEGSASSASPVLAEGVYAVRQWSSTRYVDAHEHEGRDFAVVTRPAQNNNTQLWLIQPE